MTTPKVMLAKRIEDQKDLDVKGWWLSEKLDGVRAYWDGKRFRSRRGNVFAAPMFFRQTFPTEVHLDGEIFGGRGRFAETSGIVRRKGGGKAWGSLVFYAFDVPGDEGDFEERQKLLAQVVKSARSPFLRQVKQAKVRSRAHLDRELQRVESLGGEGLMLRRPGSLYDPKRSSSLLKVKTFQDAEGRVVGHAPGRGKHEGKVGALVVESPDGKRFRVGTGLTDQQRANPPPIGTTITYAFFEKTKDGMPRFPSFLRVRRDEPPQTMAEVMGAGARPEEVKLRWVRSGWATFPAQEREEPRRLPVYRARVELPIWGRGSLLRQPEWHGGYSLEWVSGTADCELRLTLYDNRKKPPTHDELKAMAASWVYSVKDQASRKAPPPGKPSTVKWYRAGSLPDRPGRAGKQVWRADLILPEYGEGSLIVLPAHHKGKMGAMWFSCDPEGIQHERILWGLTSTGLNKTPAAKREARQWVRDIMEKVKAKRRGARVRKNAGRYARRMTDLG